MARIGEKPQIDERFFQTGAAEEVIRVADRIRRIDERLWSVMEALNDLGLRLGRIEQELGLG